MFQWTSIVPGTSCEWADARIEHMISTAVGQSLPPRLIGLGADMSRIGGMRATGPVLITDRLSVCPTSSVVGDADFLGFQPFCVSKCPKTILNVTSRTDEVRIGFYLQNIKRS